MASRYKSLREMTDEEVKLRVETDWKEFSAAKEEDHKRCRRYDAIYMALDNPDLLKNVGSGKIEDDEQLFSNTYLPIGAAVVEAFTAILFNGFFSTPHYFKMGTDNWEDEIRAYKITAHFLNKRHKEMQFKYQIFKAILQAAIYDYSITGTRWLLEEGYIPEHKDEVVYKQYGKSQLPFRHVKNEMVWRPDAIDRSDLFTLNYFNCYHDPGPVENGFKDSKGFIDIRYEMIENLKMKAKTEERQWGKYKNVEKVIATAMERSPIEQENLAQAPPEVGQQYVDSRRIMIKRYWTGDHVVEMAEGEVIWRKNLAGWPLQRWGIFDIPNRFKLMGILQRMERNQYDINAAINNKRDHENLITDPVAAISQDLLGDDGEPDIYPGRVFVANSGTVRDKIWIYNPGTPPANTMADVQAEMDIIEKVTVSQSDMGAYAGGRRTATETVEVKQGRENKTFQRALILEEICLEPIYQNMFVLEMTMLTKNERFKYFGKYGEEIISIRPEDYATRNMPQFYAMGMSQLVDDPIELQQFFKAIEMTAAIPMMQKGANWPAITAEMWSRLVPKNHQNFINDPREPQFNIPPDVENQMAARGQKLEVSEANDDAEHTASHEGVKRTSDYLIWPERFKMQFDEHIDGHQQRSSMNQPYMVGANAGNTQDSADPMRGVRLQAGGVV